jgi:hypothetical protein
MRDPETLYDLLRAMVEHIGWRDEAEARRYRELLNRLEDLNVFGHLSQKITTEAPPPATAPAVLPPLPAWTRIAPAGSPGLLGSAADQDPPP